MSEHQKPDGQPNDFLLGMQLHFVWFLSAQRLYKSSEIISNFANEAENNYHTILKEILQAISARANEEGIAWLEAEEYKAFREIMDDISLTNVAYMLLSVALENALKGILIGRKPEQFVDKVFKLKSHNLLWLAGMLDDIQFSNAEREIMEKATHYTTWKGRYFYPVSSDHLKPKTGIYLSKAEDPASIVSKAEYDSLAKLFERIFDIMQSEEKSRVALRRQNTAS